MKVLCLLGIFTLTSCSTVYYQSASQVGTKRIVVSGHEASYGKSDAVTLNCKKYSADKYVCEKNYPGQDL